MTLFHFLLLNSLPQSTCKLVLFAEYFGINLEGAFTPKTEEGLAVIVFRDLLVCIPAKVKLEKYSESVLYVLHGHFLQFVIFYEVPFTCKFI